MKPTVVDSNLVKRPQFSDFASISLHELTMASIRRDAPSSVTDSRAGQTFSPVDAATKAA